MLLMVIWKIKIFILILAIVICGFADTFYSLSTSTKYMDPIYKVDDNNIQILDENGNPIPIDRTYISSYVGSLQYSYEIVLGQFGDNLNEQDSLSWFFFVLATIVAIIVLSNLLIEIVS